MVAHDREIESRPFRARSVTDQRLWAGLLGHQGVAELNHGSQGGSRGEPARPERSSAYVAPVLCL